MVGVRAWLRLGLVPLGIALVLVFQMVYPARAATGFTLTGSLTTERSEHTATLLPSGKVLIVGGWRGAGGSGKLALQSAELYDPATGRFTPTAGQPQSARFGHGAALLLNGDVLIAGGVPDVYLDGMMTIEIYRAASDDFVTVATDQPARLAPTVTTLADGRVLIAGGYNGSSRALATALIYDPSNNSLVSTANNLSEGRARHAAVRLNDGRVLLAGGSQLPGVLSSAEIFDPATNAFAPVGVGLSTARANVAATLLPNGDVLFAGGEGADGGDLRSAEVYETARERFATVGDMPSGRSSAPATVLPDGRVLIAGGRTDGSTTKSAVLYRPADRSFVSLPTAKSLNIARLGHTATLLPNGSVLLTAGEDGIALNSAEIYTPDFVSAVTIQPASAAVVSSATNNNVVVNIAAAGNAGTQDTVTVTVKDAAGATQSAPAAITIGGDGTGMGTVLFKVATLGTAIFTATDTSGTAIAGRTVLIQPTGFAIASPPAAARSNTDIPIALTALADGNADASHYQGAPQLTSPLSLGATQDLAFGGSCPAFGGATGTCTANFGDLGLRRFAATDGATTTFPAVAVVPNGFTLAATDRDGNAVTFDHYRSGVRFTLTATATAKSGARVAGYDGDDFGVSLTSNDPSTVACVAGSVAPVAGAATFTGVCFVALGGQPGAPLAPTLIVRDSHLAGAAASQALVVGPTTLTVWPPDDTTRSGDPRTLSVVADAYGGARDDAAAYRGSLAVAVTTDAAAIVPDGATFAGPTTSVSVRLFSLGAHTITLTERDDGVAA
ncbi:MAG TPA: kelch repeat-containing protein, partial [Thermomicrobiales bacterium]|nr:kelch repeat-containing protein [Thermomicrobiales bacterium]